MLSPIPLHKQYLLHRHACRRNICCTRYIRLTCSRIICNASWMCPIGRHAVACSTTQALLACVALSATHACLRSHYLPHKLARGCKIRHKAMHARPSLPQRHASTCMPPYILLHMRYVPKRHEYSCVIHHAPMHVVTPFSKQVIFVTHTHEYICIMCRIGMHAVAYSATQAVSATYACMQAHN